MAVRAAAMPVTVTMMWIEGDENLTVVARGAAVFDSSDWNVVVAGDVGCAGGFNAARGDSPSPSDTPRRCNQ